MAQWVRAPDCSSEGQKFESQQPHGGSQPPVMRSDALFWNV
nr:LOC100134980 protein [Mus musculus]